MDLRSSLYSFTITCNVCVGPSMWGGGSVWYGKVKSVARHTYTTPAAKAPSTRKSTPYIHTATHLLRLGHPPEARVLALPFRPRAALLHGRLDVLDLVLIDGWDGSGLGWGWRGESKMHQTIKPSIEPTNQSIPPSYQPINQSHSVLC